MQTQFSPRVTNENITNTYNRKAQNSLLDCVNNGDSNQILSLTYVCQHVNVKADANALHSVVLKLLLWTEPSCSAARAARKIVPGRKQVRCSMVSLLLLAPTNLYASVHKQGKAQGKAQGTRHGERSGV